MARFSHDSDELPPLPRWVMPVVLLAGFILIAAVVGVIVIIESLR